MPGDVYFQDPGSSVHRVRPLLTFCLSDKQFVTLILLLVQVDQMVIHSASDPRPRTTLCGDYFYNYFTRGLDILFDGKVLSSFSCGDNVYGAVLHFLF